MEQKGNNHGPSNGFLLGLIVGVLLALLFTTKKGRKILKIVTEEGLDKISNLEEIIEEQFGKEEKKRSTENVVDAEGDEDEVPLGQSDYVEQPATTPSQREEKESESVEQMTAPVIVQEETPKQEKKNTNPISKFTTHSRRFFRGVPKKK